MGKCSGLKGGGHHRRALDVAANKKAMKDQQRKEQQEASQRCAMLKDILLHHGNDNNNTDMDADIYLQVDDESIEDHPCLCREYFRYGDCDKNRRCKFSHQHTIVDALSNIAIDPTRATKSVASASAGTTTENNDDERDRDDADAIATTIPALQLIKGILYQFDDEQNRYKQRRKERYHNKLSEEESNTNTNVFEMVGEGTIVMDTILSYIESNTEVVALMESCRYLNYSIGNCCLSYQCRIFQRKQTQLQHRNDVLLSKSIGGRLRYAVMHIKHTNNDVNAGVTTTISNATISRKLSRKEKRQNKKKNSKNDTTIATNATTGAGLRPILIYDYENPHVYAAYKCQRGLAQQQQSKPPSTTTTHFSGVEEEC